MAPLDLAHTTEWTAAGSADAVRSALRSAAESHGGTVVVDDAHAIEVRFGSRAAARVGGVSFGWSRKRIPVRVRVSLSAAGSDGVRLAAEATEDPGWNLLSLDRRADAYREAIARAVGTLRDATASGPRATTG